ncbi:ATP-dependent helicase [Salinicola sp. JS01]|uniref:ATP-dependent helicase n=1 Tax=Salinicola sp. JS01 TaxID=3050071 RepID=UPI00255BE35E|nr:ATP-dependent helicase [Salinicola sp. JS01]WIX34496.1 ATP-dependent helicase [Salinicola sp. JS01]
MSAGSHAGDSHAEAILAEGSQTDSAALTQEQRAVVGHAGGHARVAAVAGAGKTTTLVQRVLHLLASGESPRRLLVLMFNRAARDDFRDKLARQAPAGVALPEVRTFHSIGHRLTQSLTRWGFLPPRQLLQADWQHERLLRQAVAQSLAQADAETQEGALEAERVEAFAQFCDLVKAEMAEPAVLFERLDYSPAERHFIDAFAIAESLLEAAGSITYADLLYRPLRCLEAEPEARRRVQGYLNHVIVDEYQDINESQLRLLKLLAGEQAQVMAVGDANQCIYEWRGARADAMQARFDGLFGGASDYPLSYTFRHGHALALAANHAIRGNAQGSDQLCLAAPGNPHTRLGSGVGAAALLDELGRWQAAGRRHDEACVLVRSWSLSVSVQLQLLRAGIPFRLAQESRFVFRLPLVQALAGYLQLAREPHRLQDPAHLGLLFSQPTTFVAQERVRRLCEALAGSQQWPGRDDPLLAGLKPGQRRHLKRRWQLLCELPRLGNWPPAKLLAHVIEAIDAEKVLRRSASRREKADDDVRLLDVLIEQAGELANDPDAFIELLRNPVENRPDGVLISTVHGAKGLEWPLVMLWGLNEEDFPHFSRDNPLSPQRLEEERRLYYVAITRARERLLLLHDGGEHRPSRFLAESAVTECERIGQALASESEASVSVSEPALVARYLERIGRQLALTPARDMSAAATPAAGWRVGERLHHANFGTGEVVVVEGDPADPVIEVRFDGAGRRRLIASRAPLARIA